MSDQLLGILKIALLALLYLFFARVLWAVWSEVRGPRPGRHAAAPSAHARASAGPAAPAAAVDPTTPGAPPVAAHRVKRAPRDAASKLVVLVPKERKGATFQVGDEITIGRAPQCTITIPDDTFVSQLHARLFRNGDRLFVEDLGSTNGSHLNGNRLTGVQAFDKGDRLQVGSTVMEGQ